MRERELGEKDMRDEERKGGRDRERDWAESVFVACCHGDASFSSDVTDPSPPGRDAVWEVQPISTETNWTRVSRFDSDSLESPDAGSDLAAVLTLASGFYAN